MHWDVKRELNSNHKFGNKIYKLHYEAGIQYSYNHIIVTLLSISKRQTLPFMDKLVKPRESL